MKGDDYMPDRKIEELSELEFDVLKEISNIGTGNAATAISTMLGGQVGIEVPVIKFLNFSELSEIIGGAENEVIGYRRNDDVCYGYAFRHHCRKPPFDEGKRGRKAGVQ